MASYTNFCCRASGSNLNAGTRTGSTTVPGTSADFTYASGNWVSATGVFTVASGNPASDGVAVGDYASVYADGASVTTLVGRVTARDATTITVSTTAKSGSTTDGTGNRTLKIGGAWLGPNGASGFPIGFALAAMSNAAGDPVRVRLKNDQTHALTAAPTTLGSGAASHYGGFSTTYDDDGRTVIDGGTSGAAYVLFNAGGSSNLVCLDNLEFRNNGASGSANALTLSGPGAILHRCVIHDVRGNGIGGSGEVVLVESELYGCNQSNTASQGAVSNTGGLSMDRCKVHHNAGSNSHGVRLNSSAAAVLNKCVFGVNGGHGVAMAGTSQVSRISNCDFHANGGAGINMGGGMATVENSNFIDNTTYAVAGNSGFLFLRNCGFGSGDVANGLGDIQTAGIVQDADSVTYASGVTPWNAPATGDFTVTLAAAIAAGRGAFLETASGYTGPTVSSPNIGADQSADSAGGGGGGGAGTASMRIGL